MSGKYALIIGNTEYIDPGLAQLTAPGNDTEDFARVLKDQEIGAFDSVNILLNQPSSSVIEAIDEFFDQKKPDDLLVLYFSGHGVRDELGALYLAVRNTNRDRLRSTAVKSDYIREAMDQSRSKRQVLILDCCNSGTYAQGTKAATGVSIGTATAFEGGYGRIILTANDSTQLAWKGDEVIGETSASLFTHFLIEGLEGEADLDSDGRITVDELYDYAYERIRLATPKQTPSKFTSKQQGEIILRQSMRMENIKPVPLPAALLDSVENPFPDVRLGAVQQLVKLLNGKNLGLARSAREALERIVEEDDSRTVSHSAYQALEAIRQAEESAVEKTKVERKTKQVEAQLSAEHKAGEERTAKAKIEAEQLAAEESKTARRAQEEKERSEMEKAEQERLARQKAEAERLARAQLERESAKREAARLKEEREATKKAEVEHIVIEEPERLVARMKLDEERLSKAKKTPSGALVSSAKPKLFSGGWPWIAVALVITTAFALLATAGGYMWWRSSLNEPRETPPPLVEVTNADSSLIFQPTNTAFSTSTPNQPGIASPAPTSPPEPVTPFFTATTDMFCYDGPSTSYDTHWELYIGDIAEVFAKWSGNSDWLLVDINDASTRTDCCWVTSNKGTLNVSLDQIKTTSIVPDRMDCSAVR